MSFSTDKEEYDIRFMIQVEIEKAQRVIYLATAYRRGRLSDLEKAELETWLNLSSENLVLFNELNSADQKDKALGIMNAYAVDDAFGKLKARIEEEKRINHRKKLYNSFAIAAAILVIVSMAAYFYMPRNIEMTADNELAVAHDVAPGGNKATLTLADGSMVELSGDKQGIMVKADEFTYNDGTKLKTKGKLKNQYATVSTPRGGQYEVVLSDGTKVWLNAASSIKYQMGFEKGERVVQLSGEAYFEVAPRYISPDKKMPFIVKTATQQVEVLGTHFNVDSYADEARTRTTLVEGSVVVTTKPANVELSGTAGQLSYLSQRLKPKQQSIVTKGKEGISVVEVNPEIALDWKYGDFIFDADIKSIMRQISRWYNIEVVYEGKITDEEFGGKVSRSKNLTEVLKVLQETNRVHFKLEEASTPGVEKRVIVMP